ncbi:MAG: hypothetical protein II919_06855 [Lachnospiraceae bacterium]|nr:hypothetical protein [Lachnospiraceae bacterium]
MSKNPKIVVFKLKELIYTGIFILLGILLIILLVWMFKSKKSKDIPASNTPVNTLSTSSVGNTDLTSDNSNIGESTTRNPSSDEMNTGNPSSDEMNTGNPSSDEMNTNHSPTTESSPIAEKQTQKNTYVKKYSPGVYTTALMLNNSALEIEVCVNSDKITSVSIKNMDTGIKTMYPLIENSMKDLEYQIVSSQSLENITYTDDCKYTYLILIDGVSQALSKAELK